MTIDLRMPRLSETLPYREATRCNRCGRTLPGAHDLQIWQEHDELDRPQAIFVVLCKPCADRVVEPHARLYRLVLGNEPCPGVMDQCSACTHRHELRCRCPDMLANGGPGVAFAAPDGWVHIQMAGPGGRGRRGRTERHWDAVPACPARLEKEGASKP